MSTYAGIRLSSLIMIGCLALSKLAMASSDAGTLTVGAHSQCTVLPSLETLYGYSSSGFGSYSPTGLTGGDTVVDIFDIFSTFGACAASAASLVAVSGFSSNPGSGWLTSVTCNGVLNNGSSATYSYVSSTGTASWSWTTAFGLKAKNGSNVSCTIVHT